MLSYKPLSELDKKVQKLLTELEFKPEHIFCNEEGACKFRFDNKSGVEEGHHYYLAKTTLNNAKEAVIKLQLDRPSESDHIFIRHKSFIKEQDFYKNNSEKLSFIPKYISSGQFEGLDWLMYEFVPGETLGLAHTVIVNFTPRQVDQLIKILMELSEAKASLKTHLIIKNGAYFKEHLTEFFKVHAYTLDRLISPEQRQKLFSLTDELGTIIDNEQHYLVHGDFHPGNIILGSDERSITIIDWEQAHLGTPVLDVAKIWNRAWQMPWRHQLITSARQQLPVQHFDEQFRCLALHLLIDELVFWFGQARSEEETPFKVMAGEALAIHTETFNRLIDGHPLDSLGEHLPTVAVTSSH